MPYQRRRARSGFGAVGALGCLLGLSGCALHFTRKGLVRLDEGRTMLVEPTGRTWRVGPGGEGDVITGLVDCEVSVEGTRIGRRVQVRDWSVDSGPNGGRPFVGRLSLYGSNWILDDRSTGRPLILDLRGHEALAEHSGQLVMVDGVVVGAQTVHVLQWRVVAN